MTDRLDALEKRYRDLEELISAPDAARDRDRYRALMQEHSQLAELVDEYERYRKTIASIAEAEALLRTENDPEMVAMGKEELVALEAAKRGAEERLKILLIPPDPLDGKNIIMEIRAGTGGDEAALFAADIYRMYSRYADAQGWKTEFLSSSETGIGGFKEIIFSVMGKNVYGRLRYESGVHRVQRVPETESSGRIHTSAITVAVLPEAEETEIDIRMEDLRIDVYRSGGKGGQSVNTTDSAVRVTHLPSGLVVICQDEKSQLKNKTKAIRVLRTRLYDMEEAKKQKERSDNRRNQVGTGDRSERIRTYNFPQNRITDHRIELTLYRLDRMMEGDLDPVIEPLLLDHRERLLKESGS